MSDYRNHELISVMNQLYVFCVEHLHHIDFTTEHLHNKIKEVDHKTIHTFVDEGGYYAATFPTCNGLREYSLKFVLSSMYHHDLLDGTTNWDASNPDSLWVYRLVLSDLL